MKLLPFLYGCVIGSLIFAVGAWFVDGAVWIPGLIQFALFLTAAVLAEAGQQRRRAPVDTDTQQIDYLRRAYITGDMEAEEFERDLDRLLRPAHTYFEVTPGRWMTYAQESLADTEPHYGC